MRQDLRGTALAGLMLTLGVSALPGTAWATGNWTERLQFSGFASANYRLTDDGAPFNGPEGSGPDHDGSFQGTRVGLNFNARVSDRFRFAGQMSTTREDDFALRLDWGFGALQLTGDVEIRAGRSKFAAGLVGEYQDVGYAYPWLRPPEVIYSELGAPNGPQLTREGYTGAALVASRYSEGWTLGANLFGGDVDIAQGTVRKLRGVTLSADWEDMVLVQATWYKGQMSGMPMPAMNGVDHEVWLIGAKADWNNVVLYSEYGHVEMGDLDAQQSDNWYITLGYRFDQVLPFVIHQSLDKGKGASRSRQTLQGVGVRWDFMPRVALKAELTRIETADGEGLFAPGSTPAEDVLMYGLGLDTVF